MFAETLVGQFLCLALLGADPDPPGGGDNSPATLGQNAAIIHFDSQSRQVFPNTTEYSGPVVDWISIRRTHVILLKSNYVLSKALQEPEVASLATIVAHRDGPVEWLQEHLVADFPGDGEIMRVELNEGASEERAKIVNAIVDTYFAEVVQSEETQRQRDLVTLQKHHDKTSDELAKRSQKFHDLSKRLGIGTKKQQQWAKQVDALIDYRNETEIRILRLELRQSLLENGVPASVVEDSTDAESIRSSSAADLAKEREILQAHLAKLDALIASRTNEMEVYSTELDLQRRAIASLEDTLDQFAAKIQALQIDSERNRDRIKLIQHAK